MNLRGIVAVSGKPGLFKLVGQNKVGYILETLDDKKTKTVVNITNTKLASLEDITVYGEEDEIKLADILAKMAAKGDAPDSKGDAKALESYFAEVAPGYDTEKVYASDMKKIVNWYSMIKDMPLFTEVVEVDEAATGDASKLNDGKLEKKPKSATNKQGSAKVSIKTSAPAKKASMTNKKGV